jgi:hypothetical protein
MESGFLFLEPFCALLGIVCTLCIGVTYDTLIDTLQRLQSVLKVSMDLPDGQMEGSVWHQVTF